MAALLLNLSTFLAEFGGLPAEPAAFIAQIHHFAAENPVPYDYRGRDDDTWSPKAVAVRGLQVLDALERSGQLAPDEMPRFARRLLADHADYLLAFWPGGGGSIGSPEVRAGGCLLLICCGVVFEGAEANAHLWRLVGSARFANELAGMADAAAATAVKEAARVAVQACVAADLPVLPELLAAHERLSGEKVDWPKTEGLGLTREPFFDELDLELPALSGVKQAVEARDFDAAEAAFVAHLAERESPSAEVLEAPQYIAPNLAEADELCRNLFTLRAHMLIRHDFGEEVDWTTVLDGDIESNVAINSHGWTDILAMAYWQTKDTKYARHLARLLLSWLKQSPCPNTRKSLQWRTLEVGDRAVLFWPRVLAAVRHAPEFREGVLFQVGRSYLEHARYLAAYQQSGRNWFQVETSGLGAAGVLFPEFKDSRAFVDLAFRRLNWINQSAYFPDGFQTECSSLYHDFPTRTITNFWWLARLAGITEPHSFDKQLERIYEVYMYLSQPDMYLPLVNDCNPTPVHIASRMAFAAKAFGRDDFRFMATGGEQGTPPEHTSHRFPDAGYYIMRDKWGPDAQYLCFDAGPFGAGHQHEDKLSFVLYAGGRLLLHDPGIYSYKRGPFSEYYRSTRAHNAVMVDGKGQASVLYPESYVEPDREVRWIATDAFDFVSASYDRGFAARKGRRADRATLDTSIRHRRSIFSVKGEYFILRDKITGRGQHSVERIFHIAPVIEQHAMGGVRAGEVRIGENGTVCSADTGLANIAIVPVPPTDTEPDSVRDQTGETDPVAGWIALWGQVPCHDITFERRTELPTSFDDVLYPLAAGDDEPPTVARIRIDGADEGEATAFAIEKDGRRDIFVMSDVGAREMTAGDVSVDSEAALLRLDAEGRPTRALMIGGKRLAYRGEVLVELADRAESVVWEP